MNWSKKQIWEALPVDFRRLTSQAKREGTSLDRLYERQIDAMNDEDGLPKRRPYGKQVEAAKDLARGVDGRN